jgi:hypothetical protein
MVSHKPCFGDARTDAGKKINGRKQPLLVDTTGLMVAAICTPPTSRTATAHRC